MFLLVAGDYEEYDYLEDYDDYDDDDDDDDENEEEIQYISNGVVSDEEWLKNMSEFRLHTNYIPS